MAMMSKWLIKVDEDDGVGGMLIAVQRHFFIRKAISVALLLYPHLGLALPEYKQWLWWYCAKYNIAV